MTALHNLGILSTSFIRNNFPTVLKEFPHMLSTWWLLFLHSAIQLIPNHLNWDEVGWFWMPAHLMQHSITLLHGQIALTQHGGVLGHCPVEKQMIAPLIVPQTRWDGVSLQNALVAMLVKCALKCKYITDRVTSKAPSHLLLLSASRWEPHMWRSSVHLLCVSQRHSGWDQKSKNWSRSNDKPPGVDNLEGYWGWWLSPVCHLYIHSML